MVILLYFCRLELMFSLEKLVLLNVLSIPVFIFLLCFVKNEVSHWTYEEFNGLSLDPKLSSLPSKLNKIFPIFKVCHYFWSTCYIERL